MACRRFLKGVTVFFPGLGPFLRVAADELTVKVLRIIAGKIVREKLGRTLVSDDSIIEDEDGVVES
jgi:hypothetical protein